MSKAAPNRILRSALHRLREQARRLGPAHSVEYEFWSWVRATQGIKTVIDIGAHVGDWASWAHGFFAPQAIYLIEPLASCLPSLEARKAQMPGCTLLNIALSDESGTAPFFENSYSPASSLRHITPLQLENFPQTAGEEPRQVEVRRLDDVVDPDALARNVFLKVDVQGTEDRVIRGGQKVFGIAQGVLIEMSFAPLYEGQPLFEEVHALLVASGFRFAGVKNQIGSPRSGRPLFAHCLYLRSDPPASGPGGPPG